MSDAGGRALREHGLQAFSQGNYQRALPALTQRIQLAPYDIEARCKLAWAQSECGMHGPALAVLDAVVREKPAQAEVHFYRGVALARAGRSAEAAAALQQAQRYCPGHPQAAAWLQWLGAPGAPSVPGTAAPAGAPPRPAPEPAVGWITTLASWMIVLARWFALPAILACVGLVIYGRQYQQEAQEFRKPRVLTYSQFAALKPQKGWFRITGGALSVLDASWTVVRRRRSGGSSIREIYVPIYDVRTPQQEQVHVLISSNDPAIRELVTEMAAVKQQNDEAATRAFVERNADKAWIERDIEGIVQTGVRASSDHSDVAELHGNLAPDFVLLDQGRPDGRLGLWLYWGGIALAVFMVVYVVATVIVVRMSCKAEREQQMAASQ